MQFDILGPLRATHDGRTVAVTGPRPRALLAVLVLHAGTTVSAARLIDELWGERLPADPGNALQVAVSRLRRALDAAGTSGVLVARAGGYVLDVEPDAVDVHRFKKLVAAGRVALADGQPERAAELLRDACALWRGPVLADFAGAPFAQGPAAALAELRVAATEDRVEADLAAGNDTRQDGGDLVEELRTLVAEHPVRERLRGQLMRVLYRAGRQADALAVYQEGRRSLADELGLDPGPELQELERAMLAQDPTLRGQTPAGRRARNNLPAALTSFVGRDEEVREVTGLMAAARLVTLTGPGGAGKTRLATEVAAQFAGEPDGVCRDGVYLVELAPVGDPSEVARAVAHAVGAPDVTRVGARGVLPASELLTRLLGRLERKRLLLVLDNCEHLVDEAARLAEAVLAGCPGVRVLATSREVLGIPGERRWSVPALRVPPPAATVSPEQLLEYGATRLFLERAATTRPDFRVDGAAGTVAEICRRLDGLPLAIELAAARVGSLSVDGIAARLDDRFRLLTRGSRTALPRQQTLRAVVDWSWELLTSRERLVLRRLAVFAGGCTLDAAERVCAAGPRDTALPAADVLDAIDGLLGKSLLGTTPAGAGSGELRYRMLETVRAYAFERLAAAGETDEAARAHTELYAGFVEDGRRGLSGAGVEQVAWYWRVDAEMGNIRAALRWAIDRGEAALALQMTGSLSWFWWMSGHSDEARSWLEAALRLPDAPDTAGRCDSLWSLAMVSLDTRSALDGSRRLLAEATTIAERLGDQERVGLCETFGAMLHWFGGDRAVAFASVDRSVAVLERIGPDAAGYLASAISVRAMLRWVAGDRAAAERDAEDALARADAVGEWWGRLSTIDLLADIAEARGEYARAEQLRREELAAAETVRNREMASQHLGRLGNLAVLQGDYARARAFHQRARELAEEGGQPAVIGASHLNRGFLASREGDLETARHELELALAYFRKPAFDPGLTLVLAWLGFVAERQGDAARAMELQQESLEFSRRAWEPRVVALSLEGVAGAATLGGDAARGAMLLGAAAAARAGAGSPLPPAERFDVDRVEAAARSALGAEAFTAAFDRGSELSLEAAVELAAIRGRASGLAWLQANAEDILDFEYLAERERHDQ